MPDGDVLSLANAGKNILPLFIGEMKHQGTNKQRAKEGRQKQATGNAIERAAKNLNLGKTLFSGSDYFPYTIFCWGEDFINSATVRSKLIAMNDLYPLNQNNTLVPSSASSTGALPASIYYQETEWTSAEILEKELETIAMSLDCVINQIKTEMLDRSDQRDQDR